MNGIWFVLGWLGATLYLTASRYWRWHRKDVAELEEEANR